MLRASIRVFVLVLGLLAGYAAAPLAASPDARRLALPSGYPASRGPVDAHQPPWRMIGRLTWVDGQGSCTGALIGERLALTAAHCIWRLRDQPGELHFLAGFQHGRFVARSRARRILTGAETPPQPGDPATWPDDWALIELMEPIGATVGWLPWMAVTDGPGENGRIALAGYRADRPFVLTVDPDCRVTGFAAAGALLRHDCPVTRGDSGGPLLLARDGVWSVVGIQSLAVGTEAGLAIAIGGTLRERLRSIDAVQ